MISGKRRIDHKHSVRDVLTRRLAAWSTHAQFPADVLSSSKRLHDTRQHLTHWCIAESHATACSTQCVSVQSIDTPHANKFLSNHKFLCHVHSTRHWTLSRAFCILKHPRISTTTSTLTPILLGARSVLCLIVGYPKMWFSSGPLG